MRITHLLLLALVGVPRAQEPLQIDSVTVDSVWNSDSTDRVSRDCIVSFFPAGEGTARCTLAVSFDSGSTFTRVRDSVALLSPTSKIFPCGERAEMHIRFSGGDRPHIAFMVTGVQVKPDLAPETAAFLVGSPFDTPGSGADTTLDVRLSVNINSTRGYAPIERIYWDHDNDGVFADSTDSTFTQWTPPPSTGSPGEQALMVAKALATNGLWSTPDTILVQYGLRRPLAMLPLTGGAFTMGNDSGVAAEAPAHDVTVSDFSVLETEVTNEAFLLLSGRSPLSIRDSALAPARNMTWFSAVLFCNLLSNRTGLDTCYIYDSILPSGHIDGSLTCDFSRPGFRLPTEAEWEYACRSGTTTPFYWGDSFDTAYAWSPVNSGGVAQPVATRLPSAWGLYDMSGNVSEWVNDVYGAYDSAAQVDPVGETYGTYHAQRGGSAPGSGVMGDNVSSTCRDNGDHSLGYYYNGFRVAQRP